MKGVVVLFLVFISISHGKKIKDGGGWVAYSILVLAQGPLVLGLGVLGPGLDNNFYLTMTP